MFSIPSATSKQPVTASKGVSLEQVFQVLYKPSGVDCSSDTDVAAALRQCDISARDLLVSLQRRLPGKALSACQIGTVRLAHTVLADYFAQPAFPAPLGQPLHARAGAIAAEALSPTGWLQQDHARIAEVMDEAAAVAIGWSAGMAQADEVRERLGNVIAALGTARMDQEVAAFRRWRVAARVRAEKVAERTLSGERGALRADYARAMAMRTLRVQVAGRELPEFMDQDIRSVWLPAFQWVVLNRGDKSPLWRSLMRCFSLLVWSLLADSAQQMQKLHRVIDQLKKELPGVLEEVTGDSVVRDRLLANLDDAHLNIINTRPMQYLQLPVLNEDLRLSDLDVDISSDLLEEVSAISSEQWFNYAQQRMQLCHRDDEYRQLIFVNQLGVKALRCSFEDFAYLYASGEISSVGEWIPLRECVRAGISRMLGAYQKTMRQQKQDADALAASQSREQARDKARREARSLIELEQAGLMDVSDDNLSSLIEEFDDGAAQRRQRARLQVAGMIVGSWLQFLQPDGSQLRRKLLVVLPSSNNFIFVDRSCADKVQLTRQQLIEGLADGSLQLLQNDSRFDDALDRVLTDPAGHRHGS